MLPAADDPVAPTSTRGEAKEHAVPLGRPETIEARTNFFINTVIDKTSSTLAIEDSGQTINSTFSSNYNG